jgi:hypothetical protein
VPEVNAEVAELIDTSFEEGDGNGVVLSFSFVSDSNDAQLEQLRFDAGGTLNDANEIAGVRLYFDQDDDGKLNEGDLLISEGLFDGDDGTVEFTLDQPVTLSRGATSFIVSYQF